MSQTFRSVTSMSDLKNHAILSEIGEIIYDASSQNVYVYLGEDVYEPVTAIDSKCSTANDTNVKWITNCANCGAPLVPDASLQPESNTCKCSYCGTVHLLCKHAGAY